MEESKKETISQNRSELWNLSFRDLFYKYVRFLPLFVLSVALALLAAFMYLRYAVPVYNVGGTMLIKSETPSGRSDKFEDMFVNDKAQNIQNEIEILKSKPLMQRVVDSLNLQFTYYVVGKIKTVNIYNQAPFRLDILKLNDPGRALNFDVEYLNQNEVRINNTVTKFDQPFKTANGLFRIVKIQEGNNNTDYKVTWQPSISIAGQYAGALAVIPKTPGTGILRVNMTTTNSFMGADIVNELMKQYSNYNIEQKKLSSDQILEFIDERLADYGHKLDSVQKLYLDYQVRNNLIDEEIQTGDYFNIISESDKAANDENIRLNVANMLDDYLTDKKTEHTKVVVPSSLGLEDATLNELVGSYNKAQIERQQLVDANIPVNNPVVKEADAEIEKLRMSIRENLKNIKSSSSSVLGKYRQRSNVSENQLRAMPVKVKEAAELKRQVETVQNLYKFLQEKKEETAISRASTISSSGIIDKATPTSTPVKPNRKAIQIMAILVGLGLPALFIFIGEVLNDKVTTRFDIEKLTAAPILGEIGHSYADNTLVVSKTTRSMVAEQFRIIRSNLQYVLNKKEKAIILVTSSFSGEGKSYVSTNMGAVLALAGKKTVILEFDIRKPKVLSGLGVSRGPGITNFLVGKTDNIEELIKPVPDQDNLFVIGCGPVPPNPAELLLDPRLDDLFDWLKEHFDVILVDTAPVGMVSDAMTLSKFADCTLYLVRQGHTFKKQVALIDEFYQENKLPRVSIIINDVKVKPGYGYYGYGRYGYGYGYGYGSYYEEETPPQNFFEKILSRLDIRKLFKKKRRH